MPKCIGDSGGSFSQCRHSMEVVHLLMVATLEVVGNLGGGAPDGGNLGRVAEAYGGAAR